MPPSLYLGRPPVNQPAGSSDSPFTCTVRTSAAGVLPSTAPSRSFTSAPGGLTASASSASACVPPERPVSSPLPIGQGDGDHLGEPCAGGEPPYVVTRPESSPPLLHSPPTQPRSAPQQNICNGVDVEAAPSPARGLPPQAQPVLGGINLFANFRDDHDPEDKPPIQLRPHPLAGGSGNGGSNGGSDLPSPVHPSPHLPFASPPSVPVQVPPLDSPAGPLAHAEDDLFALCDSDAESADATALKPMEDSGNEDARQSSSNSEGDNGNGRKKNRKKKGRRK